MKFVRKHVILHCISLHYLNKNLWIMYQILSLLNLGTILKRRPQIFWNLGLPLPLFAFGTDMQYRAWQKKWIPGWENFVLAFAYHFCLSLPEKFSQPGNHSFARPCKDFTQFPYFGSPPLPL